MADAGQKGGSFFRPSASTSVQGRFVLYLLVSFLAFLVVMMTVFGIVSFRQGEQQLHQRVGHLTEGHSAIVASSLWHLDYGGVEIVLRALINDPDVVRVRVFDETDMLVGSAGSIKGLDQSGIYEISKSIIQTAGGKTFSIGRLSVSYDDARLRKDLHRSLGFQVVLGLMFLLAAVLISNVIHRRIVVTPLNRLLDAVTSPRIGAVRRFIEWKSRDELGTLVQAFNEMQLREQRAEDDLREGRNLLEQAVRERTADLEQAMRDAEQANRAKSEFLATMSHEFRTPLNAIIGFSDMVRSEILGPMGEQNYKDYINDIHLSGERMLSLVNDVLDIAAIEAGKRVYEKHDFDIRDLVEEALREVRVMASSKSVAVTLDIPDDIGDIAADRRSILQVLLNLLSNAVKFTEPGGSVRLPVARDGDNVVLRVIDTGIGIPADALSQLAEPFSQALNNPYIAAEGSGLGLSIVKSLVEEHGGRLNIESEIGKGTTVTVIIPDRRRDRGVT